MGRAPQHKDPQEGHALPARQCQHAQALSEWVPALVRVLQVERGGGSGANSRRIMSEAHQSSKDAAVEQLMCATCCQPILPAQQAKGVCAQGHHVALELGTGRVFCMLCKQVVQTDAHTASQQAVRAARHMLRSGTMPGGPANDPADQVLAKRRRLARARTGVGATLAPGVTEPTQPSEEPPTLPGSFQDTATRDGLPLGLRGLNNLGNTCFMNSVLQAFVHTPLVRLYYLGEGHPSSTCRWQSSRPCLGCEMDTLFNHMYIGDRHPYSPVDFLYSWWCQADRLAEYRQQDAHEFYLSALSALSGVSRLQPQHAPHAAAGHHAHAPQQQDAATAGPHECPLTNGDSQPAAPGGAGVVAVAVGRPSRLSGTGNGLLTEHAPDLAGQLRALTVVSAPDGLRAEPLPAAAAAPTAGVPLAGAAPLEPPSAPPSSVAATALDQQQSVSGESISLEPEGGDPLGMVEAVFGGLLRSDVRCCVCGHTSTAYDPFLDISLDLLAASKGNNPHAGPATPAANGFKRHSNHLEAPEQQHRKHNGNHQHLQLNHKNASTGQQQQQQPPGGRAGGRAVAAAAPIGPTVPAADNAGAVAAAADAASSMDASGFEGAGPCSSAGGGLASLPAPRAPPGPRHLQPQEASHGGARAGPTGRLEVVHESDAEGLREGLQGAGASGSYSLAAPNPPDALQTAAPPLPPSHAAAAGKATNRRSSGGVAAGAPPPQTAAGFWRVSESSAHEGDAPQRFTPDISDVSSLLVVSSAATSGAAAAATSPLHAPPLPSSHPAPRAMPPQPQLPAAHGGRRTTGRLSTQRVLAVGGRTARGRAPQQDLSAGAAESQMAPHWNPSGDDGVAVAAAVAGEGLGLGMAVAAAWESPLDDSMSSPLWPWASGGRLLPLDGLEGLEGRLPESPTPLQPLAGGGSVPLVPNPGAGAGGALSGRSRLGCMVASTAAPPPPPDDAPGSDALMAGEQCSVAPGVAQPGGGADEGLLQAPMGTDEGLGRLGTGVDGEVEGGGAAAAAAGPARGGRGAGGKKGKGGRGAGRAPPGGEKVARCGECHTCLNRHLKKACLRNRQQQATSSAAASASGAASREAALCAPATASPTALLAAQAAAPPSSAPGALSSGALLATAPPLAPGGSGGAAPVPPSALQDEDSDSVLVTGILPAATAVAPSRPPAGPTALRQCANSSRASPSPLRPSVMAHPQQLPPPQQQQPTPTASESQLGFGGIEPEASLLEEPACSHLAMQTEAWPMGQGQQQPMALDEEEGSEAAAGQAAGQGRRGTAQQQASRAATPASAPPGPTGTVAPLATATEGSVSLGACLSHFVQEEALHATEAWVCGHCRCRQQAVKQMSIRRLPPVLCLHVKRFEQAPGSLRVVRKLQTWLSFPTGTLDLTPFTTATLLSHRYGALAAAADPPPGATPSPSDDGGDVAPSSRRGGSGGGPTSAAHQGTSPRNTGPPRDSAAATAARGQAGGDGGVAGVAAPDKQARAVAPPPLMGGQRESDKGGRLGAGVVGIEVAELQASGEFEYTLFAVICHKGDITGGHYVAYVRCCDAWFCCDDAWVTLVEEREVAQAQAYMLFYTQRRFANDAELLRLVGPTATAAQLQQKGGVS